MLVFGSRWRASLTASLALRSDAPAHTALEQRLERASDPVAEIALLWHTARIPHRLFALHAARDIWGRDRGTYPALAPVLRAAASDGDHELKRLAVSLIARQAQADDLLLLVPLTRDVDVAVRLLALNNLRRVGDERFNAVAAACLDDRERQVCIAAANALRKWNNVDFDVRSNSSDTVAENGIERWLAWWGDNAARFSPAPDGWSDAGHTPSLAVGLRLADLSGERIRMPRQDGGATVLHFWSTCNEDSISMLRRLLELESTHAGRLRVAAVAVDAVPEFHLDGGHEHGQACGDSGHAHDESYAGFFGRRRYRDSLRIFVENHDLDGLVLIDDGTASGAYRSDELPTTVLVDYNGMVHRRFSGLRSDHELTEMIGELVAQP